MEHKRIQSRLKSKMRRYFQLAKIARHGLVERRAFVMPKPQRWSPETAAEPPWKFKSAAAEPPWNEKWGFASGQNRIPNSINFITLLTSLGQNRPTSKNGFRRGTAGERPWKNRAAVEESKHEIAMIPSKTERPWRN